jgi:hypothetical protein
MPPERPPMFTSIVFHNGEEDYDNTSMVTAPPLLQHYCVDESSIPIGNNEEEGKSSERKSSESKSFHKLLICLGILIGFLIQVVSLGAYYAILLVHWRDNVVQKILEGDWFLYKILSILTQIDKCVYFVVWVAFACSITRLGMAMLRDQSQTPAVRRRFVLVSGVLYFLVGILTGAFIALSMVDAYLGFPIPFLLSAATVIAVLMLCCMMICGYDTIPKVGSTPRK